MHSIGNQVNFASISNAGLLPAATTINLTNAFSLKATGTQNYICKVNSTGGVFSLLTPEAKLFKRELEDSLMCHFFRSPADANNNTATWQYIHDDSFFTGKKINSTASPLGASNAVPWLLLQKSTTSDRGFMSQIEFVIRFDTVGGVQPPNSLCTRNGSIAPIPYKATYAFFFNS